MSRAGKVVAHDRQGQGKIGVHRLTVLRAGPLGDTGASKAAADMFVDIAPHVSLRGLDINRTYDRRGNTMRAVDESHIQSRTKGKRASKQLDNRSHHNGGDSLIAKGQFRNGR